MALVQACSLIQNGPPFICLACSTCTLMASTLVHVAKCSYKAVSIPSCPTMKRAKTLQGTIKVRKLIAAMCNNPPPPIRPIADTSFQYTETDDILGMALASIAEPRSAQTLAANPARSRCLHHLGLLSSDDCIVSPLSLP